MQRVSLFPEKLHVWSWDLKTHPESESVSVFPEKLHDWSWDLKTHPVGESVSVFPEKLHDWSWDLKTHPDSESVSVFPEKLHDWSWGLKTHPDSESISVFPEKLHDWSWDLKTHPDSECFLRSCMTDHGAWKHIQDVSLCLCFLWSWLHDWCAQFVSSNFFFHNTLIKSLLFSQYHNSNNISEFVKTKFDVSPHYHEPCITTHYKFTLGTFTCHVCWSVWFLFNVLSILIALFFSNNI